MLQVKPRFSYRKFQWIDQIASLRLGLLTFVDLVKSIALDVGPLIQDGGLYLLPSLQPLKKLSRGWGSFLLADHGLFFWCRSLLFLPAVWDYSVFVFSSLPLNVSPQLAANPGKTCIMQHSSFLFLKRVKNRSSCSPNMVRISSVKIA